MKNCPNCGRPINFDEKYAKIVACPYCNSILEFWEAEFSKIWEQSYFIEFPSQFKVWEKINFKWKDIYVKWQLRYEYDWWFFDDFFVEIDGKWFYIREDDGQIFFLEEVKIDTIDESLAAKIPSENFEYFWNTFFIEEVWIFKFVNLKGFVSTKLEIWKEYEYLVWIHSWKKYIFEKEIWSGFLRVSKWLQEFKK